MYTGIGALVRLYITKKNKTYKVMTKEQAAQAIEDLLADRVGIEITITANDVDGVYDCDTLERYVDIDRAINEQCDIIYYSRAMDFLAKNDPSLTEAFDAAYELGYDLKDLNSETLASVLNNRYMRNAYYDCRSEIDDILSEIEHYDEDEED